MSLYSGKRLHAYKWQELPIDKDIVDRVHELATHEHQLPLVNSELLFEWAPGIALDDDQGATVGDTVSMNDLTNISDPPPSNVPTNIPSMSNQPTVDIDVELQENETQEHETRENETQENETQENETQENEITFDDALYAPSIDDTNEYENDDDQAPATLTPIENEESNEGIDERETPLRASTSSDDDQRNLQTLDQGAPSHSEPALRRSKRVTKGTNTVLNVSHDAGKRYEVTRHKYFLQRSRKKHKPKIHLQFLMKQRKQMNSAEKSIMDIAVNAIFAQKTIIRDKDGSEMTDNKEMPASKGFKLFGEEAVAAMIKEF